MSDMAKICDTQNEIIKMQSDIIDNLFLQVLQYTDIGQEEKVLDMIEIVQQKEAKLWKP